MDQNSFLKEYFTKMGQIQEKILCFLDQEENNEQNFQNLINYLNDKKIREDASDLKLFLTLISKISANYLRGKDFHLKIKSIINYYLEDIKRLFSNYEIFNIFKESIYLLYFLFQEGHIFLTDEINDILLNIKGHNFIPVEFKYGCSESFKKITDPEILALKSNGENETFSFELIRNDSINEFIEFLNKNNKSVNSDSNGKYETNSLLIGKYVTFIEYAAFNGSIQIFKYLLKNKAKMSNNIWLYAIHGQNPEIIHLIEENLEKPKDNDGYKSCIIEAIKCYSNDLTDYFINNSSENDHFLNEAIEFYNFEYISKNIDLYLENLNTNDKMFYNLLYHFIQFNYANVVKFLIQKPGFDINAKIISKKNIFLFGYNSNKACLLFTFFIQFQQYDFNYKDKINIELFLIMLFFI